MRALRGLVVAVVVIATCVGANSAQGATGRRDDPRGDLWTPRGFHGWDKAGRVPNADLRTLILRNQSQRIVIIARFANLRANEDESDLSLDIKTRRGRWTLSAQFNPVVPDGFFALTTASDRVECDLTGQVDYARDVLRMSVPQSCIHGARWIQYRGFHRRYNEETGVWYDDVLTDSHPPSGWSERVRRSSSRQGVKDGALSSAWCAPSAA